MKTLCRLMPGLWLLLLALGCSEDPAQVVDNAGLFRPEQAEQIGRFHRYLLADHDIDYRVLTLNKAVDINAYSIEQFEKLQVGSLSKTGRGLLLVIDNKGNQVRLEVSRALEGPYPDALIAYIEQRQMTPFFAVRRIVDGVLAATELIVTRAQHTQANQGWDDEVWAQASAAGAGATADARIPEADESVVSSLPENALEPERFSMSMAASDSPEAALQAYLQAMSERNADPDLAIYSDATRAMLKQWVVTPAQMDSIVKAYRNCHAEQTRYNEEEILAVIRYPVAERTCAPWFFVGNGDHWQLDLTGAQRYLRFGRDNSWHFDWRALEQHPYRFAFADWGFDNRGYPQTMRWNLTVASDDEGNVWVERTGAGSAAEAFGFQVNDRLLRWNGEKLHQHHQVLLAMQSAEPAAPVRVDIVRKGEAMTLEGEAPPRP